MTTARILGQFVIAGDHPCLPGHFPGNPVVPGAVLLDEAVSLVLADNPGRRVATIIACKFPSAVGPGDRVEVRAETGPDGEVMLSCVAAGAVALRGTLRLADAA